MNNPRQLFLTTWISLAAAGALFPAPPAKPKNPLGEAAEVVAAGRALYNKTCTGCHGPDGSDGDRAPSLNAARRYFRLSEAAIFDAVKNGIPGSPMPSSPLPEMEVWKIVAFIRNIRATASDNHVPGDVENGMKVFMQEGGCRACHMIRGQGGTLGPDLSSVGAQLTLQKLRDALTTELPPSNGFRPVTVITAAGLTVQGVARNEDAFSLQLLDRNGKLHLFDRQELRAIEYGKRSPMPRNIDKRLSEKDFQDLIAMLSRQARSKMRMEQQGENEVGR